MDVNALVDWALKGTISLLFIVVGYLLWQWMMTMRSDNRQTREIAEETRDALSDHKLNAASTYATKAEVTTMKTEISAGMKQLNDTFQNGIDRLDASLNMLIRTKLEETQSPRPTPRERRK